MPRNATNDPSLGQSSVLSLKELGLSFDTGAYFLSEDEKTDIIEAAVPFLITAIDYDDVNKFGARYVLSLVPAATPTAPVRGWSFSCAVPQDATDRARRGIEERAAKLEKLMTLQTEAGGRPIGPVVIVQKGRFRTIHDSSGESASTDELGF